MSPVSQVAGVLFYISTLSWVYLYMYPIWLGCGFPLTQAPSLPPAPQQQFPYLQSEASRVAPFRLLVLADPQLEGDSSLPDIDWPLDSFRPEKLGRAALQSLKYVRKALDLWGNDRYLAHIFKSLRAFTDPTHVTVLGDLLGSQWISDEEFERRADRFWKVVFAGASPIPEFITRQPHKEELGHNAWKIGIMSVVGNHDVGYAGDMNEARVERFERRFGPVNWDVEFELPARTNGTIDVESQSDAPKRRPSIRIQVLNSMNLDTPAYVERMQSDTYAALNSFIERSRDVADKDVFTILLTHVPLYKPEGVCTDAPYFNFHPDSNGGGIKEQNLLSEHVSKTLLEGTFGMGYTSAGRKGIILTGHDHEGCDVWHYLPPDGFTETLHGWNATRLRNHLRTKIAADRPGIREVTMRAMMGEYDGNAAFLSAWYDEQEGEWGYAVSKCALGPQHIWWAIHVLFLITALVGACASYEYSASVFSRKRGAKSEARRGKAAAPASIPGGTVAENVRLRKS